MYVNMYTPGMINATQARKELFELIREALQTHQPIPIQHREGGVVLLATEEYESLLETLELLSIPGFRSSIAEAEADIEAGRTSSIEEVFGSSAK